MDESNFTLGERAVLAQGRLILAAIKQLGKDEALSTSELQAHLEALIQADEGAVEALKTHIEELIKGLEAKIKELAAQQGINPAPLEEQLAGLKKTVETIDEIKAEA